MAKRPEMTALLRELVVAHNGNLTSMALALTNAGDPITRQGVARRLSEHDLTTLAAGRRFRGGVAGRGRRIDELPDEELTRERERIAAALAKHPHLEEAAVELGLSRRALSRRIHALGLAA